MEFSSEPVGLEMSAGCAPMQDAKQARVWIKGEVRVAVWVALVPG